MIPSPAPPELRDPAASPEVWRGRVVALPANRVWRTYRGGRWLDGRRDPSATEDGPFPEDWLASTTAAVNPPDARRHDSASPTVPEGVSVVRIGGQAFDLRALLAAEPDYFLGPQHVRQFGADPRLLVKLLDPAMRLHFQVHPSTEFAQTRLQAPSGKTEAYHVLAVRPEVPDPCIYLGFSTPPSRDVLRRWIETQDIPAIERAMNRLPVAPGDTYLVPGGVPHALGAGVFLVELQEPSDLVVRFEFERGGYVLPESARFMNRGLEFALEVFDHSAWSPERIDVAARCRPRQRRPLGADSFLEDLIGPHQTPCFRLRRAVVRSNVTRHDPTFHIVVVTAGAGRLRVGAESLVLRPFDAFVLPAGLGPVHYEPASHLHLLECLPPG